MDETVELRVPARGGAEITVQAGETWEFAARGWWVDWYWPCRAGGYRPFVTDVLGIYPAARGEPWFKLIGGHADGAPDLFAIGSGCRHTFARGGTVRLFANDLAGMAWNNWGTLRVRATRLPAGTPPADGRVRPVDGDAGGFGALLDRMPGLLFVTALVLAACLVLAGLPQGRDLVRTLGEYDLGTDRDGLVQQVAFPLATLLLALEAWFWPRMIVEAVLGPDRTQWRPRALFEWWPRLLGLAPFLAAGWAMLGSAGAVPAASIALMGLLFLGFVLLRRRFFAWLRGGRDGTPRGRRGFALLSLWLALAVMLAAIAMPVRFGCWLGAPSVTFLGIALIIPAVTVGLSFRIGRWRPLALLLTGAALLAGWLVDNHGIGRRAWPSSSAPAAAALPRLTLAEAFSQWRAAQAGGGAQPGGAPPVLVLVAAEGGASRAGYWAAQVLGQLERRAGGETGRFSRHVLAMNSVSGGSLGTLGFAATLAAASPRDDTGFRIDRLDAFARTDFLSPALVGMLFPDLVQRFVPLALPFAPDRAETLERGWEDGWDKACGNGPGCAGMLARPFLSLPTGRQPDRWLPIPIVQGMEQSTGRRIFTSRLRLAGVDGDDLAAVHDGDVPVSTAMHNGARFPVISPAGTLTRGCPAGRLGDRACETRYIVDGGYFDNSGVEAMSELAAAIHALPDAGGTLGAARTPIVILSIGNGPDHAAPEPIWLNDPLAPLIAFAAIRTGHGAHILARAGATGPGCHSSGALLTVCRVLLPTSDRYQPPMDWALSGKAQRFIECAAGFDCRARDDREFDRSRADRARNAATIRAIWARLGLAERH